MKQSSNFTTIGGKRVHYVESRIARPGDTLLLLHGKSFKAETWSSIGAPGRVNEMGMSYIAVDYPGWGESEGNDEFYPPSRKYSNAAIFIEEFAENLGLKRFSLLGASFSGPFVISYASKHPESVNNLILIGPVWSDDLSSEASMIRNPVLIMYGENDNVIPTESFLKYSNSIKGSRLRITGRAGHALYLDNREEFFRELEEFLRS
ncbi:MAG: alpha/beta hydrolase [Thermoplasmatales archaeon]|nr:alpha/beta hydrolase [Thermoplasmatales archaeon]